MAELKFTEKDLDIIRSSLGTLSEKRRTHILEVEKMAARIGAVYMPGRDSELILRAAALLHDVTKEFTADEHISVFEKFGMKPTELELAAPKTLHAMTAAALIPEKFPLFADKRIISAVRWHTTGKADMSMAEKIIYLSDYIDESRKFGGCIMLRKMFWDVDFDSMTEKEKLLHLTDVLIESFNVTLRDLIEEGKPVHPATNDARNFLCLERLRLKEENT